MDPIIITAVIASGVVFLFVLAWKLAWFMRKMSEDPGGEGAEAARAGRESVEDPSDQGDGKSTGAD